MESNFFTPGEVVENNLKAQVTKANNQPMGLST